MKIKVSSIEKVDVLLTRKEFKFDCFLVLTEKDSKKVGMKLISLSNKVRELGYSAKFENKKTRLIVTRRLI